MANEAISEVTVFAVFDDGKSFGKRTRARVPVEGTIGDAIDCFKENNAASLWETSSIKFVGILSKEDLLLRYDQVTPDLLHPDSKIQEVMVPHNKVLVFRSAGNDTDINGDEDVLARQAGPAQGVEPDDQVEPPLRSLITDCLVAVMTFLEREEMDDFTLVDPRNRSLRDARNNDSLDQTRMAKLNIVSRLLDIPLLFTIIQEQGWYRSFPQDGNKTILKVNGIDRVYHVDDGTKRARITQMMEAGNLTFASVCTLDISNDTAPVITHVPAVDTHFVAIEIIKLLLLLTPNAQKLDMTFINTSTMGLCEIANCPQELTCLHWNGPQFARLFSIGYLGHLVELSIEGMTLLVQGRDEAQRVREYNDDSLPLRGHFLFEYLRNLKRLNVKDVALSPDGWNPLATSYGIRDQTLIKMVCMHPSLVWLKSNLTDDNIAALLDMVGTNVTLVN